MSGCRPGCDDDLACGEVRTPQPLPSRREFLCSVLGCAAAATVAGCSERRTRRAVIVDEGWRTGSLAAEISARIMEAAFWDLDAPVERICSAEVPIPYPTHLEQAALPQVAQIVAAAKITLGKD